MLELIRKYTEVKFNLVIQHIAQKFNEEDKELTGELMFTIVNLKFEIVDELLSNNEIVALKSESEITNAVDEIYNKIVSQIFN